MCFTYRCRLFILCSTMYECPLITRYPSETLPAVQGHNIEYSTNESHFPQCRLKYENQFSFPSECVKIKLQVINGNSVENVAIVGCLLAIEVFLHGLDFLFIYW